jgi:hypothetical protein
MLLVIAGCSQQQAPAPQAQQPAPNATAPAQQAGVEQPGLTGPGITERPGYLNASWFTDIPPFPKDLYKMRSQIKYGEFWDMASIGPEYYKQPEFNPTFESIGLPLLQSPSGIAPWGYGAYPADIQVLTFPGDNFTVATFVMSSWGVQTYQGVGVSPAVSAVDATNVSSQEAAGYFSINMSPSAFYIGPTYQKFDANWSNKVVVDVKVSKNAKRGAYYVDMAIGKPPANLGSYWRSKFGGLYTEGSFISTQVGRPYFRLSITVT